MRLCRTGKHGDTMRDGIPIFFSSCGKENGHSWSKEKTLRDELTGKAVNSPKAGAGRHALPTKSGSCLPAALYPNIKSAYPRTCGCRAKWRAKPNRRISTPVRSASLRTTRSVFCFILVSRPSSPWEWFPKAGLAPGPRLPSPGEGVQMERAAALALCARGGMGDGGVPHVSGGGLRGRGLYAKGLFPLPHSGSYPLREQKTYYNTIESPIPSPYHSD